MSRLSSQIPIEKCTLGALPLFHVCEGYKFRNILESGVIQPSKLDGYGEQELSFYFYGKPSYRISSNGESSSLMATLPCCFIIEAIDDMELQAVYPFDSGAFIKGLFRNYHFRDMQIEQFRIAENAMGIRKFIEYFYGDNIGYFNESPLKDISYEALDFEIEAIHSLITQNSKTKFDDRKSSIEIQMSSELELKSATLKAVIMPSAFGDDPRVRKYIESLPETAFFVYQIHHGQPMEYFSEMRKFSREFMFGDVV